MNHPTIVSLSTANPPERFSQEEVLRYCGYVDPRRRGFFEHSLIEGRYLAIDRETFSVGESIDELQERFKKASVELGARALRSALSAARLEPHDLDFLVTTTCTGRLCPSLDAYLIGAVGLRSDVQRVHVGDTGCSSAIVGLQAAANYLRAHPGRRAAVVASEISSAAYFLDEDLETAVANALFSDGAGAVVLESGIEPPDSGRSPGGPRARILDHRTLFRPEHVDLMGFTFPGGRQRILLSKDIRHIAADMMGELAEEILRANGLAKGDISHWVLHSAGRSVLERAQEKLALADRDLAAARTVLSRYGNMSSATVLFVLREVLDTRRPREGDRGIMIALGPGFAAEGILLGW